MRNIFIKLKFSPGTINAKEELMNFRMVFNSLTDIEKHYIKKEHIIFPFLEKYGVTGPSTVMWGKDDEVRGFLKSSLSLLSEKGGTDAEVLRGYADMMFSPAADAIEEMIVKEEKILSTSQALNLLRQRGYVIKDEPLTVSGLVLRLYLVFKPAF